MPKGIFDRTGLWLTRVKEGSKSSEARENHSKATTKYYKSHTMSKETRDKISKAHKGKSYSCPGRKGKASNWSVEGAAIRSDKIRMSKLGIPHPLSDKTMANRLKEKEDILGVNKEKITELYINKVRTISEIAQILTININKVYDLLIRYKISRRTHRQTMLLRPDLMEIWKKNVSKAAIATHKIYWSSEENRQKWAGSFSRSPNKLEISMEKIIKDNGFPYKYVGSGEVIIGYWNPDFININGQKKLIEVFGDYWHRNDNPQSRINRFKKYGFDTLVIWEHELKSVDNVVKKIREFDKHQDPADVLVT